MTCTFCKQKLYKILAYCTPPILSAVGGGVESPKGGLVGPQLLEGVAGKEGVTFFLGGVAILQKKSGIFNDKKSL